MVLQFKRSFCLQQGCKIFGLKQGQSLNSLLHNRLGRSHAKLPVKNAFGRRRGHCVIPTRAAAKETRI